MPAKRTKERRIRTIFLFALGQRDFVSDGLRISSEDDATFDHQVDGGAAVAQDGHGRAVIHVLQRDAVDAHDAVVDPTNVHPISLVQPRKDGDKKAALFTTATNSRRHSPLPI